MTNIRDTTPASGVALSDGGRVFEPSFNIDRRIGKIEERVTRLEERLVNKIDQLDRVTSIMSRVTWFIMAAVLAAVLSLVLRGAGTI